VLLIPWFTIVFVCLLASWYSLFVVGLDTILAPILKLWFLVKPLLFKTLPAVLIWFWTHTGAKALVWIAELTELIVTLLGGWKAWSVKKVARQAGRFSLSLSARFVAVNVLYNLLFGHERRSIKLLPRFAMYRLHRSRLGFVLRWWKHSTERQKRLLLGVVVCLLLVLAGHTMLGISVLLFDLVWELLLLLWRLLLNLWRIIGPMVLKMVPNFIGNFVTQTLLPLIADVVPVIRDDHRVIYLRLNVRRHVRRLKTWLYLNSRSRRQSVRNRITPLVGETLRQRKTDLIHAVAKIDNKKPTNEPPPPKSTEV